MIAPAIIVTPPCHYFPLPLPGAWLLCPKFIDSIPLAIIQYYSPESILNTAVYQMEIDQAFQDILVAFSILIMCAKRADYH